MRCLAHGAPSPPPSLLYSALGLPGCFSVKTMPVEEEHGHSLFRAVGDSHTVGKREARSSCSVVLLCPHLWLSLASPLPSSLRCGTIGLSCDVPTVLTTDGPFPAPQCRGTKERSEVSCGLASALRAWCTHSAVYTQHGAEDGGQHLVDSANASSTAAEPLRNKRREGRQCVCLSLLIVPPTPSLPPLQRPGRAQKELSPTKLQPIQGNKPSR